MDYNPWPSGGFRRRRKLGFQSSMKLLFVHQNYPGPFRHIAPALARSPDHRVAALHMRSDLPDRVDGVQLVSYRPARSSTRDVHPWLRDLETKTIRGEAAFRAASAMRERGYEPDIVVGHPGWGEMMFLKDVWPQARMAIHCEDEPRMLKLTQELFGASDPELNRSGGAPQDEQAAMASLQAVIADFFMYFNAMTMDRQASPKDDVASVIANAKIDGEPISPFEAMSYYVIVATAGHDTTSSSTAGGMWALAKDPAEFAKVKAEPALIPGLVDEAIRWTTPVKHFMRAAMDDYELRGRQIRKGDWLYLAYPSGNRDEEVFEDPFAFRSDRKPNKHLAFGYGAHLCLGQHLAKLEMRILFEELLPRLEREHEAGEQHRDGALAAVQQQRRQRGALVAGAQHVGRADIAGADGADIAHAGHAGDEQAERNGAEEIAEKGRAEEGGGGRCCEHWGHRLSALRLAFYAGVDTCPCGRKMRSHRHVMAATRAAMTAAVLSALRNVVDDTPADQRGDNPPGHAGLVERRVLALGLQVVAVQEPGFVKVEHDEVGGRAGLQRAAGQAEQGGRSRGEGAQERRQGNEAGMVQAQGRRQHGFDADGAGHGLGEGQALGLHVLGIVVGDHHVDQAVGQRVGQGQPVVLAAQRRGELAEGAVAADVVLVEGEVVHRHRRRHRQALVLGAGDDGETVPAGDGGRQARRHR